MKTLVSIIILISTSINLKAETINYVNQAGSTMSIEFSGSRLTGEYITALGCEVGLAKPLTGWINGNAISFSVDFGACDSITSWVGHIEEDGSISTLWTLAKANAGWDQKLTGASHFTVVD